MQTTIDSDAKQCMQAQKDALVQVLRTHGIAQIIVSYSGEGDSGCIFDIDAEDIDAKEVAEGTLKQIIVPFPDGARILRQSLPAVLEYFIETLMEFHDLEGYENNEGGGGEMVLNAQSGNYTLEHYINIIDRYESSHEG